MANFNTISQNRNINLNTLTTPGLYSGQAARNSPRNETMTQYTLIVTDVGNDSTVGAQQIFVSYATNKIYTRYNDLEQGSTVWTEWTAVDHIKDYEITNTKLDMHSVDTRVLDDYVVTEEKLAPDCITNPKIAYQSIDGTQIMDSEIEARHLDTNAVTTDKIKNSAVTSGKIASGSVTTTKLDTEAVTKTKLASNAVTTLKLADNAVTEAKLASQAVTTEKLADYSVTINKIAQGAINNHRIQNNAVDARTIVNDAIQTDKIKDNAVTTQKIADGVITASKISDNAVGLKQLDKKLGDLFVLDYGIFYGKTNDIAYNVEEINITEGTLVKFQIKKWTNDTYEPPILKVYKQPNYSSVEPLETYIRFEQSGFLENCIYIAMITTAPEFYYDKESKTETAYPGFAKVLIKCENPVME